MLHNFSESRHIIYSFLSQLKMYTYMRINARVTFKLDTGWRHLYQFIHFFRLVGWVFSTFWFSLSWSIELMILTQSENYTNFLRILNIHLSYESAFLHNWQGGATKDSVSIEYFYISKNKKSEKKYIIPEVGVSVLKRGLSKYVRLRDFDIRLKITGQ